MMKKTFFGLDFFKDDGEGPSHQEPSWDYDCWSPELRMHPETGVIQTRCVNYDFDAPPCEYCWKGDWR